MLNEICWKWCCIRFSPYPEKTSGLYLQSFMSLGLGILCPRFAVTSDHKLGDFKETDVYFLTVLKAARPQSKCWQDHVLSESSRVNNVPWLSLSFWYCWKSLAFFGLQKHHLHLPSSSHGYLPGCMSLWPDIPFL